MKYVIEIEDQKGNLSMLTEPRENEALFAVFDSKTTAECAIKKWMGNNPTSNHLNRFKVVEYNEECAVSFGEVSTLDCGEDDIFSQIDVFVDGKLKGSIISNRQQGVSTHNWHISNSNGKLMCQQSFDNLENAKTAADAYMRTIQHSKGNSASH